MSNKVTKPLQEEKPKLSDNIGKKIDYIRRDRGLTQEELANILNTTHSTISAYESGKTTILTAFAYEICKRYNISMDYLCGRTR